MKHGIGIITTGKRTLQPSYINLLSMPTAFYVHVDYLRQGPGHSRNECIKHLYDAGCDYITLFDDDCYPIKGDWQDFLLGSMEKHHIECLTYTYPFLPPLYTQGDLVVSGPNINAGVFFTISRRVVETVGYFNPRYKKYGWEEHAYFTRVRRSGINPVSDGDVSISGIGQYIHPEDYFPTAEHDHYANNTQQIKDRFVLENKKIFDEELASDKLYYPYEAK